MLIQQFTYPVHRATVEKFGEKWTQPGNYVSSGAYILKEWRVNSHITMDKNPAYYDSKKVSIPQAVFLAIGKEYDRYRADEVRRNFNSLWTHKTINENGKIMTWYPV